MRWEYKTVDFSKPKNTDELNRMGSEGWEAVAMVTTWGASEWKFAHPIVLVKRPLAEAAAAN